jgi:molybdenum cofactor biosynthesis enzyme MoaA
VNDELLNKLFGRKANDCTEIEIHLFEYCNLSCTFCGQDHDSKVGFDTIVAKSKDVTEFIKRSHKSDHILNIMGGEIFNDQIPDSLFDD